MVLKLAVHVWCSCTPLWRKRLQFLAAERWSCSQPSLLIKLHPALCPACNARVQVLGHAWFGSGKRELLPYIAARRQIYLPAYQWVLENKVQPQLTRIAQAAQQQGVVLLDYDTNNDIDDVRRPLSHASLVAAYVRQHWHALLQAPKS